MSRLLSCLRVWVLLGGGSVLGASQAMAGSVTTDDASPLTKCTSYTSMAVTTAGDVIITGCTLSQTAPTFAITTAASAVTTGTPLALSVARTINTGGSPGSDTLTLTSTVAGIFTPATLSFTAADGASSTKTSSITFSAVGTATLSATGATTVTPSGSISVSAPITSGCSNTISFTDSGNLPIASGVKYDIFGPMALRFRVSSSDRVGQLYFIQYDDSVPSTLHNPMDTTISTCAGDFSASGMLGNPALCKFTGVANGGPVMSVSSSAHCRLEPNVDYYLNIRPTPPNGESAFVFMFN